MTLRIVDNKRVNMTEDEFDMYQKIVKSYTTPTNKGEELFMDLFETDGAGIIIYLKPPTKFRTSFEVFLFLMSLMQHQHLRLMQDQVADMCKQVKDKLEDLKEIKIWYKAVCDEHREMIDIFVNNVATTHHYLLGKDEVINTWLQLHYGCDLRLIHHDSDMDECFNENYSVIK